MLYKTCRVMSFTYKNHSFGWPRFHVIAVSNRHHWFLLLFFFPYQPYSQKNVLWITKYPSRFSQNVVSKRNFFRVDNFNNFHSWCIEVSHEAGLRSLDGFFLLFLIFFHRIVVLKFLEHCVQYASTEKSSSKLQIMSHRLW